MPHYSGEAALVRTGANTIAEGRGWSVETSVDIIDDTVLLDAWKTHVAGKKSWSAQLECLWDETDTAGQEALVEGSSHTFNFYPEGNTTGDKYLTGTGTITSVSLNVSEGQMISRTYQITGNGAITWSTAP